MKFVGSIRWQLQLWHGALLAAVLLGFGAVIYQLQLTAEYQRVDRDLERRVAAVTATLRDPDNALPRRPQPRGPEGPGRRPAPRGGVDADGEIYFVAWAADGRELTRSATAPSDLVPPARTTEQRSQRLRGTNREYVFFTPQGECVLIGRDIAPELFAMRRFLLIIVGAGASVFVLGLAVGWWVSTRALRPIAQISADASRISTGNLAQRIAAPHAGSELFGLVSVLNDTFGRLQAGFARQARFTADASHELRTPVSVVLTQTQSALVRERSAEEYRESLAACERAAKRMNGLIESLLALARIDGGDPVEHTPCALSWIATETVELLRPLAERKGLTLVTDCAPARCLGDPAQLGQVVTNLLDNAIEYSLPGGTVRVATSTSDSWVTLAITDTGIGIGPDDLPHIFDRFYRADRSRSASGGRSGLGLAITQAIVEAHGGSIQAISALNQGTTMRVTFPELPPQA